MTRMTRRSFLQQTFTAGAAIVWAPTARVLGANDDLRVAVVGVRSQGQSHIQNFLKLKGVRLVALCDADRMILDRQVQALDRQGHTVEAITDVRRLLERRDIDALSTATPNHWHALLTVWACQAGKDVCVEKPVSHNIWEGRQMVVAARKYQRLVQGDFDQRSRPANDAAAAFLRSGGLGKVLGARGFCYKYRASIGQTHGQGHIPASLDYDLWCGPARKGPINRKELHYDWHWVWETGCGELGNNGPHQLDEIRWMLGETGLPRRVMSLGGRFGYRDAGETPNTQLVFYDYASAPVIYEVRGLPAQPGTQTMNDYAAVTATGVRLRHRANGKSPNTGVIIQCEAGFLDLASATAFDNSGKIIRQFSNAGALDPQANFVKALRSRQVADLKTDIAEGHLSTSLCHAGNVSYRVGATAQPEAMREAMRGDPDAAEAFERFAQHLAVHGLDLHGTPAVLGPWLTLDSAAERFTGPFADRANALVKREYRPPFVIPEYV